MYTPHPADNRVSYVSPARLAEAGRRVHQIRYDSLVDVYDVIRELAKTVQELSGLTKVFSVFDEYTDGKAWIKLVLDEWSHPCANACSFVP